MKILHQDGEVIRRPLLKTENVLLINNVHLL